MHKSKDYSDILFKSREQANEFIILNGLRKRTIIHDGDGYRIYFKSDLEDPDLMTRSYYTGTSTNKKDYSYRPYLKIAKELGYSKEVMDKIRLTRNEVEVGQILASARHGRY